MDNFLAKKINEIVENGDVSSILNLAVSLEGEDKKAEEILAKLIIQKGGAQDIYNFAKHVKNAPLVLLAKGMCNSGDSKWTDKFANQFMNMDFEEFVDVFYDEDFAKEEC